MNVFEAIEKANAKLMAEIAKEMTKFDHKISRVEAKVDAISMFLKIKSSK
jgi:protein required for attachment to host cells